MSHKESAYTRLEGSRAVEIPGSEVILKPKRRQYSAEYKQRILQEYEVCTEPGSRGALLRREGLYSSHITAWRRQRDLAGLSGLAGQKRGPKVDAQTAEIARLEHENERLRQRLQRAELIIDVQKNVSQLLGLPLEEIEQERMP
jgi:transposase-like protein